MNQKTNINSAGLKSSRTEVAKVKIKNSKLLFVVYGLAVLLLFFGGYFLISNKSEQIMEFVASSNLELTSTNDVVLVLNKKNKITIANDSVKIKYSRTGKKINIGKDNEVVQSFNKRAGVVYNTLLVPYGKRIELLLPDGSKVWVNSGSKLVFPATFTGKTRELFLEGEAIFDVAHNAEQPFVVRLSEHNTVMVLGTVFSITSYPEDAFVQTTLKSGSVKVNYRNAANKLRTLKIAPGTQVELDKNQALFYTKQVDVASYFSWREGVFVFQSDNLNNIFKRISRYYNVSIEIDNTIESALLRETFSGSISLKENVENVIFTIQQTSDAFTYKFNKDKILIKPKQPMDRN